MTQEQLAALAKQHGCKLQPIKDDYVPQNSRLISREFVERNFLACVVPEFSRCTHMVADDPQSGPIYCGSWATVGAAAPTMDSVCYWCEKHAPRKFKVAA